MVSPTFILKRYNPFDRLVSHSHLFFLFFLRSVLDQAFPRRKERVDREPAESCGASYRFKGRFWGLGWGKLLSPSHAGAPCMEAISSPGMWLLANALAYYMQGAFKTRI